MLLISGSAVADGYWQKSYINGRGVVWEWANSFQGPFLILLLSDHKREPRLMMSRFGRKLVINATKNNNDFVAAQFRPFFCSTLG